MTGKGVNRLMKDGFMMKFKFKLDRDGGVSTVRGHKATLIITAVASFRSR